jgi:hypothetical protein
VRAYVRTYVRTSASLTLMSTESCSLDNCTRALQRETDSAELPSPESVRVGVCVVWAVLSGGVCGGWVKVMKNRSVDLK